jgi:type I restriction enzyme S subunit
MSKIRMNINDIKRYAVLPGDVLMNEGGDLDKLGRGSMWRGEFSPCVHQNHVFVVRCGSRLSPDYLNVWTGATPARRYFMLAGKQTTNLASINKTALSQLPVALPPRAEQTAIATILSDMDAEIAALEDKLIVENGKWRMKNEALLTLRAIFRFHAVGGEIGQVSARREGVCVIQVGVRPLH